MHPMFCCGCFSCLPRSLDLASACCVLRSLGLCVCGGAFFSAFAECMRKQVKVKVAYSNLIKKQYLIFGQKTIGAQKGCQIL